MKWYYQLKYRIKKILERCGLCGGRLNSKLIEGKRITCHGSIVVNGNTYYICHNCFILKNIKFPSELKVQKLST